jgi:hypothetical protein
VVAMDKEPEHSGVLFTAGQIEAVLLAEMLAT